MNEILERVNELNEVLNNGYGVQNMVWVKTKVVELQNVVKENCTIPDVIKRMELLVAFIEWYREDDMSKFSPEHLADWFLKSN